MTPAALLVLVLLAGPHEGLDARLAAATRAVEAASCDAEPLLARADLYLERGDLECCLADAEAAEELQPGRVETALVRGRALAGLGRLEQAELALDRYLAQRPDDVLALLARAEVRERAGDSVGAEGDLGRVLARAEPAAPAVWLACARVTRARGDDAAALAVLGEGCARLGGAVSLELAALELELELCRLDEALARVERLRAAAPRTEGWTARRGDVLALAGRASEARTSWRLALEELARLPAHVRRTRTAIALAASLRERLAALEPGDAP